MLDEHVAILIHQTYVKGMMEERYRFWETRNLLNLTLVVFGVIPAVLGAYLTQPSALLWFPIYLAFFFIPKWRQNNDVNKIITLQHEMTREASQEMFKHKTIDEWAEYYGVNVELHPIHQDC